MILAYVLGAQKNRLIETVCIDPDQNACCIIEFIDQKGGSDFRLYDGSDLKTYLLMRW